MNPITYKPSLALAAGLIASIENIPGVLQFGALGVVGLMVWLGHVNQREERKERALDREKDREERKVILEAIHSAYQSNQPKE